MSYDGRKPEPPYQSEQDTEIDRLTTELAQAQEQLREAEGLRKQVTMFRDELMNPPPDIQERVLKMLGVWPLHDYQSLKQRAEAAEAQLTELLAAYAGMVDVLQSAKSAHPEDLLIARISSETITPQSVLDLLAVLKAVKQMVWGHDNPDLHNDLGWVDEHKIQVIEAYRKWAGEKP